MASGRGQDLALGRAPTDSRRNSIAIAGLACLGIGLYAAIAWFEDVPIPLIRPSTNTTRPADRPTVIRGPGGVSTLHQSSISTDAFSSYKAPEVKAASPETIQKLRNAMKQVLKVLPAIKASPTTPAIFKERFAMLVELLSALPESDRLALFPEVDIQAISEFSKEYPKRACALVDKLLRRVRILL